MVIEAGAARGRRMTSFRSIRTDVENAAATWVDEEAFNEKMLEAFHEGVRAAQAR